MRAPTTLRRDAEAGVWVVTIRDDIETEADREIVALPCETLAEMIDQIRGRTQVQWFELTALVLTYRSRNYLLPLMATPLSAEPPRPPRTALLPPGASASSGGGPVAVSRHSVRPPGAGLSLLSRLPGALGEPSSSAPDGGADATTAAATPGAAPQESAPPVVDPTQAIEPEQFAAAIERALEERIRVVPRSGDAGPLPSPFPAGVGGRNLSPDVDTVLLPTDVRVQDRRGVMTRDPITGTWRFVMQGERIDMGERGIELLPSTALERMERFVRQSEMPPALLVSGRLTRFEGRNYLLPSSFRSLASGRWIYP